ncbi:FAD binding domain-containing protein [Rhodococcus coprophilus]|uniref:Oxidoreductase FAD-binding subunit n=1 Tax=Rhodococcus coprophilus TaxID=38310 RepID=A0A2X4U3K3_9NOCA|nr:FAD binding domain-containing protein [Rhodococcus coprophilus]MBM7458963.1 CO/xanthine dehydrogenase FAD-binding subunit [Rhodococcus coprophilus]SQI34427.1 oxidoreductase FAD-binding subunit [Rhodococcus coprophilus]
MDLHTVADYTVARSRDDLAWGPGTAFVGGGTWLFSEPQPHLRRLVDLSGLDWPATLHGDAGLEIAATCTVEELSALSDTETWTAAPLFRQCADALLASWKIWKRATVGGNICLSLPAGAMISLAVALDADVVIWSRDGDEKRVPVEEFVTGAGENILRDGDILRSIRIAPRLLDSRTAMRKISFSPLGRSGAVVIGRRDSDGAFTLSITAATTRPYVLRFPGAPSPADLEAALASHVPADAYYADVHGTPSWRRAVTQVLAQEVREELS